MSIAALEASTSAQWDDDIVPQLIDYIRMPAKSPHFDPRLGGARPHRARRRAGAGVGARASRLRGLTLESRAPRRAARRCSSSTFPPGGTARRRTVLLYGHLDKQPEMTGWREGLGPWTPVLEDGKLYGRGGADDGYAVFAALAAMRRSQAQGVARTRAASA